MAYKNQVLDFDLYSGLRRASSGGQLGEGAKIVDYRAWLEERSTPPPLPGDPATLGQRLTRSLSRHFPNLGAFVWVRVQEAVDAGRLTGGEARVLVSNIERYVRYHGLKDPSTSWVDEVDQKTGEMEEDLTSDALRFIRFYDDVVDTFVYEISLTVPTASRGVFQKSDKWRTGYFPIIVAIFLCIEPGLKAMADKQTG